MTLATLAVRARGLGTRRAPEVTGPPATVEDLLCERAAQEIAILRRWGGDAVTAFELDEDRRTLRAIARGIVAGTSATRRAVGAVPTSSLPRMLLARIANAASFADVHELLGKHPLADAFEATDLFDVEHALAHAYFASVHTREPAFATYLAQLVDVENVGAALALSARGGDLAAASLFLPGGRLLDRSAFLVAAASEAAPEQLARVLAGTPLSRALFAAQPAAIEDAALAWHLATQTRLRRLEPLGLAPVLWLVLRRREEARRLRARAWAGALGGGS